jgi:DNA-3-methyladenine glycosylase
MKAPAPDFYERPVVEVARALIGCTLEHEGCAGVIVETEAYHESEPASHSFVGITPRTETLFGPAGRAYVYRSYGIHALFNVVCEPAGIGAAVLIRALEPTAGLELMRRRRGRLGGIAASDYELCSGPGKLTQALGISLQHNGQKLGRGGIRLAMAPAASGHALVVAGPRIGITRAVELPWRFSAAGSRYVSRPRPLSPCG